MTIDVHALRLPRTVQANPYRAQVLYDGQCPLCCKSVGTPAAPRLAEPADLRQRPRPRTACRLRRAARPRPAA